MKREGNQQKEKITQSKEKLPLGIKIISILLGLFPVYMVFALLDSGNYYEPIDYSKLSNIYDGRNAFLMNCAILVAVLGIFLWKRKNWARFLVILGILPVSAFSLFWFFLVLPNNTQLSDRFLIATPFVVTFSIFIYLTFNQKVKHIFNPEKKGQAGVILVAFGISMALSYLFSIYLNSYIIAPALNPYNWEGVVEPTDPEFKRILSYKFSNGLEQLPWTEEANGGWRVTDGSVIVYEKWLKTTFGYSSSDHPVLKVYLEGISENTFENYLKEVENQISEKIDYNDAWYSLSWDENSDAEAIGGSYIIFPDKKLGIFLFFYNHQSLTKQEAEQIIHELVDNVRSN